jgi:hypothetical protein
VTEECQPQSPSRPTPLCLLQAAVLALLPTDAALPPSAHDVTVWVDVKTSCFRSALSVATPRQMAAASCIDLLAPFQRAVPGEGQQLEQLPACAVAQSRSHEPYRGPPSNRIDSDLGEL